MRNPRTAAVVALVLAAVIVLAGCGSSQRSATTTTAPAGPATSAATTSTATTSTTPHPASSTATTVIPATAPPTSAPARDPGKPTAQGLQSLRGRTVLIDPGHNGGNGANPSIINQLVPFGNGTKECDTTGTETDSGYPESAFNWDVALRLKSILEQAGAHVVLTRGDDTGVGPCITERAALGNNAHADAAISIHADGGPPGGYGFHVIWPAPIPSGATGPIIAPSYRLAVAVRDAFAKGTGEPTSTYLGSGGLDQRGDLGGLDLSTVPKVFVECLNMRNASDAAKAQSPEFRQQVAVALSQGLANYLG